MGKKSKNKHKHNKQAAQSKKPATSGDVVDSKRPAIAEDMVGIPFRKCVVRVRAGDPTNHNQENSKVFNFSSMVQVPRDIYNQAVSDPGGFGGELADKIGNMEAKKIFAAGTWGCVGGTASIKECRGKGVSFICCSSYEFSPDEAPFLLHPMGFAVCDNDLCALVGQRYINQKSTAIEDRWTYSCAGCNKSEADATKKFSRCGRCNSFYYCSEACQKEHWPKHKSDCKQISGGKVNKAFRVRDIPKFADGYASGGEEGLNLAYKASIHSCPLKRQDPFPRNFSKTFKGVPEALIRVPKGEERIRDMLGEYAWEDTMPRIMKSFGPFECYACGGDEPVVDFVTIRKFLLNQNTASIHDLVAIPVCKNPHCALVAEDMAMQMALEREMDYDMVFNPVYDMYTAWLKEQEGGQDDDEDDDDEAQEEKDGSDRGGASETSGH